MVCEEGGGEKTPVSGLRAEGIAKCLHISASYLHCPLGDYQHTIPSLQDYRDKIKPEWILHSSNRRVFTKAQLSEAFLLNLHQPENGSAGSAEKEAAVRPNFRRLFQS